MLCASHVPLCVPKLPLDAAGCVDADALRRNPLRELLGKAVPPTADAANALLAPVERMSTATGVLDIVLETVAQVCGVSIDADGDLFEAGLSSLTSARLRGALQKRLGLELPQRLLLELPSVRALSASLFGRLQSSATASNGGPGVGGSKDASSEDPSVIATQAAAELRSGNISAAEELMHRAASALGIHLDAPCLEALLATTTALAPPAMAKDGAVTGSALVPRRKRSA